MSNLSKAYQDVINCIPKGYKNQKHINELTKAYGFSRAFIQTAVKEARNNGIIIISGLNGNGGLYRPDLSEGPNHEIEVSNIKQFITTLRNHGIERLVTAKRMREALEEEVEEIERDLY